MTTLHEAVRTNVLSPEARNYIEEKIELLQLKRLDTLNSLTLAEIFKDRSPFFFRATEHAAHKLVRNCLDHYLASTNEAMFADFEREFAPLLERGNLQNIEPIDIIDCFAKDRLPLWTELLESYDKCLHRLLWQFYQQLCNEDATINWERMAQFISECKGQEHLSEVAEKTP